MDHTDHVNLLRGGVDAPGSVWADFGAGSGAFTLALAELLGPDGEVYAIDRDSAGLRTNKRAIASRFPGFSASFVETDFIRPLDLPLLDGIVMANALHFERDQDVVVRRLRGYLRPGGRFVIVEYNIELGNGAVPHPVSFSSWEGLAGRAGFEHTQLLMQRPSRFLKEIYSAVSW